MEVEGVNVNHQHNTSESSSFDERSNDEVISTIENIDDDAKMTLESESNNWEVEKENRSNDPVEADLQELEEMEEDVKHYYVADNDDSMDIEEMIEQQEQGINIIQDNLEEDEDIFKQKADDLDSSSDVDDDDDDDFEGFDEEPYEVFEIKQINKRIEEECISENEWEKNEDKNQQIKKETEIKDEKLIDSNIENDSLTKDAKDEDSKNIAINIKSEQVKKNDKLKTIENNKNVREENVKETEIDSSKLSHNEIYFKPLRMGWKREYVQRANPSSSKDRGEAYYITPGGKKLRTKNEIIQYLTPDLTIDNFTFAREPIGFGPEGEIVRSAKLKASATDPVLSNRKSSGDSNLGKRVPKPKAPKGASPPPQGWTASKAVKATTVTTSPRTSTSIKNAEDNEIKMTGKSTPKSSKQTKKNIHTDLSTVTSLTTWDDMSSRRKSNIPRQKISPLDISAGSNSQQSSVALNRASFENFSANFFGNLSVGYDILLHTFQYLKVQELLRAACVCRMWNVAANHRSLWRTVRMKNSQINNWTGLSVVLKRNETKHLDLRKMLISSTNGDEMWTSFSNNIQNVTSLEAIDLCRCSSKIVENIFLTNPNLKILNAVSIKDNALNLENLCRLKDLQELRLKPIDDCALESDLTSFRCLKNLKHLSLTSFIKLGTKEIGILGELVCLETLELGECTDFNLEFVTDVLPKLKKLERLRLEQGQEPCCTLNILEAVSKLPCLTQLELVNFDVRTGFDDKLSQCKNLKKLLLIPTYVSQSATTNNIILRALLNLSGTLRTLTWVVTLELLRVTALYVVQCDDKKKDNKVFDESIPVLKPVPNSFNDENNENSQKVKADVPQVEILPLAKVEKILSVGMPETKFKILKVPYHATWRQNLIEIQ